MMGKTRDLQRGHDMWWDFAFPERGGLLYSRGGGRLEADGSHEIVVISLKSLLCTPASSFSVYFWKSRFHSPTVSDCLYQLRFNTVGSQIVNMDSNRSYFIIKFWFQAWNLSGTQKVSGAWSSKLFRGDFNARKFDIKTLYLQNKNEARVTFLNWGLYCESLESDNTLPKLASSVSGAVLMRFPFSKIDSKHDMRASISRLLSWGLA